MNRDTETRLIDFCVRQHRNFSVADWLENLSVTALELATAARFLAGVSWYGHPAELSQFAAGVSALKFCELANMTGFDPSRFANRVKVHLSRAARM